MSQTVTINFSQGLNQKTDPWQLPIGQFLSLKNSRFQQSGLLQKREGYLPLVPIPPAGTSYLTTLNEGLLAIGSTISADAGALNQFITKGNLQPCSLSVAPIVRNNINQIQADSAIYNGVLVAVYTSQYSSTTAQNTVYSYAVLDAETQQNIIPPASLPVLAGGVISGSSRVFVVAGMFVVISPVVVAGTTYLQYFSIPASNPSQVSAAQNVYAEAYIPLSSNPGWDGVVLPNGTLVVAYNTTTGGQGIHVTSLIPAQIIANQASGLVHSFTNAAYKAGLLSVCADTTVSPNVVYISFWNPTTSDGYTCAVYTGFGTITNQFTPQKIINSVAVANIASCAQSNVCTVFSEVTNAYSYDATIPSNFINAVTVSSTGTVGSPYVCLRSVGLGSKAFVCNGTKYFLAAFQSPFQPTYFLINGSVSTSASPVIVAQLASQNGVGYLTYGLPGVTISGTTASTAYLYKQDVQALNTLNNTQQTTAGGIYSQLGVNQVTFDVGTTSITSAELAQNLHLSGGYLSHFDSNYPVEHNFFLFPDSVEAAWTENSVVTPTGTFASGSNVVTLSSASGVYPGMSITDTSNAAYIPAGTTILYLSGVTATISKNTTHAAAGDNLSIQGNIASKPDGTTLVGAYFYQFIYEWSDAKGNAYRSQPSIPVSVTTTGAVTTGSIRLQGPMLRVTQKIHTPVKITGFRWSAATQVYNQFTSIVAPLLNDTTIDSWSVVDTQADANIIGNSLIYTTGGVIPDSNGPACDIMTIFDTRLVTVSAEDPNVLNISKTVIEGTPVEMCNEFTIYVAPNIGTVSSTGPIRALAPMDDKLIIFKNSALYYMSGTGPDNLGTTSPGCPLGNYSPPIFISSVIGTTNVKSIVLIPPGLMFQTDKGIWLLNRALGTSYIGAPVEGFNSSTITSATCIPDTNFVLFTLNTGQTLMYDYYFNQWGEWDGPGKVISSCIFQGKHTVLNSYGQLLQQTPGNYLDGGSPVLMQFTTSWINLASLQGYQRFYEFYLLARYLSPHTLQVNVAYDYNDSAYHSSTIKPVNFSPSVPGPFGIQTPFGAYVDREQFRIHAKQQLCQSFAISVQEVFDPTLSSTPGAGFTMSGLSCEVLTKKATRPIPGAFSVG